MSTNPYASFCQDFYVNMRINTQLTLPHNRETVLHFFERVQKEFADVKRNDIQPTKLGELAERELFALHSLVVGKVAPEIEGKDLDGVIEILTKYTTIKDPAVYHKIVVPAFSPNGEMNAQSIKDLQQWYVENGFVQTPVALDEFFDTSYLEHALGIVGRR